MATKTKVKEAVAIPATKAQEIHLQDFKLGQVEVEIEGVTPLLMNRMSDTVKSKLSSYTTGKAVPREIRNLEEEVQAKIHLTPEGKPAFPVQGFKAGMIRVANSLGLTQAGVMRSVRLLGSLTPIQYEEMVVNKTWARTAGRNRTPKETWRPEFRNWKTVLQIRFEENSITPEQVVNLLERAGFFIGVGDWRPDKNGEYGQYKVARTK